MLKNLWNKRWMLRSILYSLYFNFHYLPLKQAIKLPIILYISCSNVKEKF